MTDHEPRPTMRLDDECDGTPQPCSQPMDKETANAYVQRSRGQLQAYMHKDGKWYLYDARPRQIGVQPKVPVDE